MRVEQIINSVIKLLFIVLYLAMYYLILFTNTLNNLDVSERIVMIGIPTSLTILYLIQRLVHRIVTFLFHFDKTFFKF